MKWNFLKNEVVTGKTPFFVIGPLSAHHSICLNIGFCYDSFVQKWCVSNVLSTKIRPSSFLKKVFVFQKISFKVKLLKTFKFSTDCHIKTCRSLISNGRLLWKSLVPLFKRTCALSVGFKKTSKKSVFQCLTKANSNFAVKPAEKSNHSCLLSIWWITFFKHLYSLICDNGMYRT